ncbi:hypothetical protein BJX99DRAFT_263039 [Aspergillus californicus]
MADLNGTPLIGLYEKPYVSIQEDDADGSDSESSGEQPFRPKERTLPPEDKIPSPKETLPSKDKILPPMDKTGPLQVYQEACRHFRSEEGVTYVSNDLWLKYRHFAVDSHIFVGNSAPHVPIAETMAEISANGETTPVKPPVPARFRLMNRLLVDEMRKITRISTLNNDHVAPFRSIIPYEARFRERLSKIETEFSLLKEQKPDDIAVTRTRPWLAQQHAYSVLLRTQQDGSSLIAGDSGSEAITSYEDDRRMLLDGLRALIYLLDHDLAGLVHTYRNVCKGTVDKIDFAHLWYLFWPGQEILTKQPTNQVYRVLHMSGGRRPIAARNNRCPPHAVSDLVIDCFYLDYDGEHVRAVPKTLAINPYIGELPVTGLSVYPLQYERQTPKQAIIKRGHKFVELAKVAHKRYKGLNLTSPDFHKVEDIDSDVIIDFELAFRSGEQGIEPPTFGGGAIIQPTEEDANETHGPGVSYDDEELIRNAWSRFIQQTPLLKCSRLNQITDEHLVLLPQRVFGYVLLSRKWYPLDIDRVTELPTIGDGGHDAFDELVLPKKHRKIIRALVQTHARAKGASYDGIPVRREFDIVKGKGKGLIILLHGAPGVGKTSTAECVAAHCGRPLFPITCGDLGGTSAQEVEQNLERFFDLAMKWGCVLLLDEADVFLGERIQGHIVQNSLVSVFLRVLEYYSGVLILTTNRVGQFDEAATSRIHCALYYPPFTKERTLEVWQKNLNRLKRETEAPVEFNEKEIMRFAKREWKAGTRWNGRQIKNAFQTAVALADWDTLKTVSSKLANPLIPKLQTEHFEAVVETSKHFESYLIAVRKSDRERAKMNAIRRDDVTQHVPDYYRLDATSKKGSRPTWPSLEVSDDSDKDGRHEDDESSDSSESASDFDRAGKKKTKKIKEKRKAKEKKEKKSSKAKNSTRRKRESESSDSKTSSSSSDGEADAS